MDELPKAGWREFMLWIIRRRWRRQVVERSMYPLLKPGDEVLVNPRAYRQTFPQPGDIVVAHHPHKSNFPLIKRIEAITAQDTYILLGDNLAESTDSRTFGAITIDKIVGQVTSRFA